MAGNQHLYLVKHEVDGERYVAPVVGDDELVVHLEMAESFGAHLAGIMDVDFELRRFVWNCCFDGVMNRWIENA